MTFIHAMSTIIGIAGAISTFFFRKGGVYNPHEMPVKPPTPIPAQTPVLEPIPASPTMLERFCRAIERMEGGPSDASQVNCNPGNFRCSPVGYLPKYGNVKCSPAGFAVFPTYAVGWEYLMESVHHRATAHPAWTVLDFFRNYAPKSDGNNPEHYAQVVASACGVTVDKHLKDLFG